MNKKVKLCLALCLAVAVLVQYSFSPQAMVAYGLDNPDTAGQTVEAKSSEQAESETPKPTEAPKPVEEPKATEEQKETESSEATEPAATEESSDVTEAESDSEAAEGDAIETEDPLEEELEEEAEEEEEYPAVSFTKSAGGVTVHISAPEGALPEGADVKVTAVSASSVQGAVDALIDDSEVVKAVDITFYNKEGKEIEPKKAVSVSFTSSAFNGLNDAQVVHIKDNGAAERVSGSSVSGSKASFKSDDFSIYVVVEGDPDPDARLFVNFHKSDGTVTMSLTKNQLDAGQMNTNIYDPGVDLGTGEVFKGWIEKENYAVSDAENGMDIAGVRAMVKSELLSGTVTDGKTIDLYAMVFKAYHVSYCDELEVTIHTDEVLYKQGDTNIPYTFQFAYTPYYVTGSDSDDETKAANFDGWKLISPEVSPVPVYDNGKTINMADFDLSETNLTLTVIAKVAYGHWLVFNENGSGASYTEPLFVGIGETPEDAGMPSEPTRPGFEFVGWYTDEEGTAEFDPTQEITQTTTVYAKWNESTETSFTVLIWKESLSGGYDFVRSIPIENVTTGQDMAASVSGSVGDSTIEVDGQDVFVPFADDEDTACEGFTYKECKANSEDGLAKADGTSVLNVYFDRREYTLKFYYGAQNRDGSWRIAHNNNTSAYTWGAPGGFTPGYNGSLSTGTDGTGDGSGYNTYHYASITAKYGEEIGDKWPGYGAFNQASSGQNYLNSWILMPGAKARTGQYGGDITVKGKISTMDEQLLGDLGSSTGNYLVAQYNSQPNYYTYYIYFKNYDSTDTRTHAGSTYGLFETVDVRSGSGYDKQHAPAYKGYEEVYEQNNGVTSRTGREIYYYYDPLKYPVLFMDGLYETGSHAVLDNKSSNKLRSLQDDDAIEFKADISNFNKFDPSEIIPDGDRYVFLGWYSDDACSHKYEFKTMPEGGVTVYAKWVLKEYKITLHPREDGDPSFKYINGHSAGHYGTNGDVIYVDNGEKLGNVGGTRDLYDLIGWFTNESLSKVWDFDAFTLNDTIVGKYGKLYVRDGSDDRYNPQYPGTVGEVDLYASWRKILDGANGINVEYTAVGLDDKGNTIEGIDAPTDPNEYSDQAQAIARPAAKAPLGSDVAFQCWVVQKWVESEDGTTGTWEDTEQKVFPGDRFRVNYDDSKISDVVIDPETGKIKSATYTVRLRAHYGSAEDATPTHIYWYNNYTNSEAGIIHKDDDLAINQTVEIPGALSRTGYDFLGWARKAETNDAGKRVYTYSGLNENDLYVAYDSENNTYSYKRDGETKTATGVFADENMPYQGMYAVWAAKNVKYTVEFYYKNDSGQYVKDTTLTDERQAKTGSTVTVTAADKAQTKGDKYVLNESASTLTAEVAGDGSTVLKLYFDSSTVSVTVNHYLKGTTNAFKTDTITGQQVGGQYTAEPETKYQEKDLNVSSYDPSQTITVGESDNVISIYYTLSLTITAETKSKTYDGTPLNGEYTISGQLSSDTAAIKTALGTAPSITTTKESPKNYLTEKEQASITGIPGYYVVTYTSGTLTITQNAVAITVVPGSGSKVYDGTALTKTAHDDFTVTGVPEGFTWTAAADGTVTNVTPGTGEKSVNAVTEFKIFKGETDVTDQFSNISTEAVGTLAITARPITIKANDANDVYSGSTITYDTAADAEAPYYKVTNQGDETGLAPGQSITAITITGEGITANTYPITITEGSVAIGENTANYTITLQPGTLTITQNTSAITVVPGSGSKVYDGTPLTKTAHDDFTVTGVPEGFTWTANADGTVTNVTPGEGEKAVNAVTEFKIFNASGEDVTGQFSNITKSATGTLTITARPITIKANDASNTYTGSTVTYATASDAQKPYYKVTNQGEDTGLADGQSITAIAFTGEGIEVDTYPITITGGSVAIGSNTANYAITLQPGTLTITHKGVTITAGSASRKYDGSALTQNGFESTPLESGDTHKFEVVMTASSTITDAGTKPNVVATVDGVEVEAGTATAVGNYMITAVNGTLTVSKRSVTVTSASAEKVYDGTALTRNNPVSDITVSGDGFVEGEEPLYRITGSQTEVGSSDNTFDILTDKGISSSALNLIRAAAAEFKEGNYEITKVYGKLTVTEAPAPAPAPEPDGGNPTTGGNRTGGGAITVVGTATPVPPTVIGNPNPPTTITDNPAPKAVDAYWALINLLCAIATALLSIFMLIRYFGRRKEEDEETGEEYDVQRKGKLRIASIIPAIGAIIAFILTEDMSLPMQMIDKWTFLMIIILAIQALVAIFANARRDEDDEEEATA